MTDIRYVAPPTVDEAVRAFAAAAGAGRILAGGTDLLVQMRNGMVKPGVIIDIKKIEELRSVTRTADGGFRIGAAVAGAELAENAAFRKVWPGVLEAVNLIGSKQVQGRASPGGNLCHGSPAADSVPAMIAAGAVLTIAGPTGGASCRWREFHGRSGAHEPGAGRDPRLLHPSRRGRRGRATPICA